MSKLELFIADVQYYFSGNNNSKECNIIRKHTKNLSTLGDVSFPIKISNWYNLLNGECFEDDVTIFDYKNKGPSLEEQCNELRKTSLNWSLRIDRVSIMFPNAYVFLERSVLVDVLQEVLDLNREYGSVKCLNKCYNIKMCYTVSNVIKNDLTFLRLVILTNTANNFIKMFTDSEADCPETEKDITLNKRSDGSILCGPVLNEKGLKTSTTTDELYKKRACDMRMMAQHKYGVQIKKLDSWENYFDNLGKACVTIEMLCNKAQKPIKITMNNLQTANKGPSFIFYNCARITALLKEFDKRVQKNMYPKLPNITDVDFSSVNQPEEWELFYVYILQYPILTKSCIKDIDKGILNVHYLVAFLSNMCSLFSTYYRRIRILTDPREHLYSVLHARIYLLKGIQYVFHHALFLMDIEPVKEM